jgi:hypothetical protein
LTLEAFWAGAATRTLRRPKCRKPTLGRPGRRQAVGEWLISGEGCQLDEQSLAGAEGGLGFIH